MAEGSGPDQSGHSNPVRPKKRTWLVLLGLLLLGLSGLMVSYAWVMFSPFEPAAEPAKPPASAGSSLAELVNIPPGTEIGNELPQGWTHRMVCTGMSIDSGDLHLLPELARKTAARIRTAMLIEVDRDSQPESLYQFKRVGIGLTMQHQGVNRVVTSTSVDQLGIPMSMIDRFVLSRSEKAVHQGRLAARTPTFALYDASVEFKEDDSEEHKPMFLRHALLLDSSTGDIRVPKDKQQRIPTDEVIEVACPLDFECGIHVKAQTLGGKIPVGWYFAMTERPTGSPILVNPDLAAMLSTDPATSVEALAMETSLQKLVHAHARPKASQTEIQGQASGEAGTTHSAPEARPIAQSSPSTPSL